MNCPHCVTPWAVLHWLRRRKPTPNPSANPSAIVVMGCLPNKSSTGSITLSATSTMGGLAAQCGRHLFDVGANEINAITGCFY